MKNSRESFFFTAASIYLLVVLALYSVYSADYFAILGSGNPVYHIVGNDLISGRFFGAFLGWAALDFFENYPLYVAATAVVMGMFLTRLYFRYFKLQDSLLLFAFFSFSFLWSGAMFDLLSFREVPHHALAVFALAYAFLALEDWPSGARKLLLRALVVVCLFGTYQPAVVMLVVLSLMKGMFDSTDGVASSVMLKRLFGDALTILLGLCFYVAIYIALKGIAQYYFSAKLENPGRKLLDFNDPKEVSRNLKAYLSALWSLFKTPSVTYGWSHVGLGLSATFLAFYVYVLKGARRRFLLVFSLGLMLVACLQDPANVIVSNYWPTLRSSFYVALVPGLLVAYLYGKETFPAFRRTCPYVIAFLFALYAMAGFVVIKDVYEIRARDYLLARKIADTINSDPRLASAKEIRFSTDWDRMVRAYYGSLQNARFEFGTPLMAVPWSVSPYFRHVTGLDLQYKGNAICGASDAAPRLNVTIQDGVLDVCY